MTARTPHFAVGARVIVTGTPHHPVPAVREGGPGVVISERTPMGTQWVRLDAAAWYSYLPDEMQPEPTI